MYIEITNTNESRKVNIEPVKLRGKGKQDDDELDLARENDRDLGCRLVSLSLSIFSSDNCTRWSSGNASAKPALSKCFPQLLLWNFHS